MNWLDHSKTLREQGVDESEHLLLRRKFFFSDQNVDARDPVQLNLLYVQVSAPPCPSSLARARREALGSHSRASLTCIREASPVCVDCKSLAIEAGASKCVMRCERRSQLVQHTASQLTCNFSLNTTSGAGLSAQPKEGAAS